MIVEAVRTPIGRRDGALFGLKAVALLRHMLLAVTERAGIEPGSVEQIIGGCVSQVGEQGLNVTCNAWLPTGLDYHVGCTTVDINRGSAQQANHLVAALIATGAIEVAIACGVESMSRVPAGSNAPGRHGRAQARGPPWDDPSGVQLGGAEQIARRQGSARATSTSSARCRSRGARAWAEGRFDRELVPMDGLRVDEGLRESTVDAPSGLRPVMRGALHTAATISQVSDGAAAVLWMSQERGAELSLRPRG